MTVTEKALWVGGGVLNARQRVVDDEHVSDVLRALRAKAVEAEAANESRVEVLVATDSPSGNEHVKRT